MFLMNCAIPSLHSGYSETLLKHSGKWRAHQGILEIIRRMLPAYRESEDCFAGESWSPGRTRFDIEPVLPNELARDAEEASARFTDSWYDLNRRLHPQAIHADSVSCAQTLTASGRPEAIHSTSPT